MSSPEHKEKIWNYIKDIQVGMLVTEDDPFLRARPMHIVQNSYDGTLWFFTRKDAEKVHEAQDHRNVCLTFSDADKGVHVSLSGRAKLTQDQDLIDEFWNPFVSAWFEGGRSDDNVALLEIKINKGEHWESIDSTFVKAIEIAKTQLNGSTPNLGENEKFG